MIHTPQPVPPVNPPPPSYLSHTHSSSRGLSASRESTALLALCGAHRRAGADPEVVLTRVDERTALRCAVGIARATTRDKLLALAVPDVGRTGGVLLQRAGLDGTTATATTAATTLGIILVAFVLVVVGCGTITSSPTTTTRATRTAATITTTSTPTTLKTAALLASLGLSAHTGADADSLSALRKRRTTLGRAVSFPQTLAADKLGTRSVPDVLLAGRIGKAGAGREVRGSLDCGEGH